MSTQLAIDSGGANGPESTAKEEPVSTGISHLSLDMDLDGYGIDDTAPLDILPSELLLLIFSYIDAPFLIETVSKVCQKFFILLSSSAYWKTRLTMWYHPSKYPPVPVDHDSFDWMNACMETEYTSNLWQGKDDKMEHLCFPGIHYGTIDAVHLFQDGNLLAAGSRDRSITVFDLTKPEVRDPEVCRDAIVFTDDRIHKGWVWCISSHENLICSGSWDSYIRLWDTCAENPLVSTYNCRSPVLDIHMENNHIISGGNDKCLYFIDIRTSHVRSTKIHMMPILCLAVNDKHIITGSEDGCICIYDQKANAVFKKITLEDYPMCLSYSNHQLWVGDRIGQVYLIDTSQDKYELVQKFDFGSKKKLTCIKHSLGALFTSSADQYIRIMEPTLNPKQITCFDPELGEIGCMDFHKNNLVCAGRNFCVDLWRPKEDL